jgi:hypothetical protein
MAGVAPVGLGAPLRAATRAGLGGLGKKDGRARPLQLLDHEPPARGGLHGRLDLAARPATQEAAQALPIRRTDAPGRHLPGGAVKRVEGDLGAVHVEADNDGHSKLLTFEGRLRLKRQTTTGRHPLMPPFPDTRWALDRSRRAASGPSERRILRTRFGR